MDNSNYSKDIFESIHDFKKNSFLDIFISKIIKNY